MNSKYDHLWNNLPKEERERLLPHMLESQILHIKQCKTKAVRAHSRYMSELDEHIKSIEHSLSNLTPF